MKSRSTRATSRCSIGGFNDRFRRAAAATRDETYLWTIDDLYRAV